MQELLNALSEQGGLLGTLLALSIMGNVALCVLLLREKDKRIASAEKVGDNLTAPIQSIDSSLKLLNEKVTNVQGAR